MYINDGQQSGTKDGRWGQPAALRPSQHYYYAEPNQGTSRASEFAALGDPAAGLITNGEFGRTLGRLSIPAKVVSLLKLSNTFMTMVGTLDNRYVSIWVPAQMQHRRLQTTPDGVVTSGTFTGRRVIEVQESMTGSMFEPYDSPDNTGYYDAIRIKKPDPMDTLAWIEVVAHETGHAFNLVTRTSPAPAKMADRIRAAVVDESATRGIEAKVVAEILKTPVGGQQLKGQQPSTRGTNAFIVERDFFPSQLQRTYLEHFVLSELMRATITKENLTTTQIKTKNLEVNRIPLTGWRSRSFASNYSKLRFWLRVIDFRWQQLSKMHPSRGPGFERGKEIVLQEHANAFFGGIISYTPLPPSARPKPPVQPARSAPVRTVIER